MDRANEYIPNRFSARARLLAVVFSTLALAYCLAELAVGYTYMPGKRGGVLLSGVPTAMVATASLLFCIAAMLVVVDHYDTRENEAGYLRWRARATKTGIALGVMAPVMQIALIFVWTGTGKEPLPLRGFAAESTWHDPAMRVYADDVEAIGDSSVMIGLFFATLTLACMAMLAEKFKVAAMRAINTFLLCLFGVMLGAMMVLSVAEDFLRGEVKVGARSAVVYTAQEVPAAFNAVLLTKGIAGSFILLMSGAGLFLVVTGRAAPAPAPMPTMPVRVIPPAELPSAKAARLLRRLPARPKQ